MAEQSTGSGRAQAAAATTTTATTAASSYIAAVAGLPLAVLADARLEVKDGPSGERGVFSTAPIAANTTLIQVPFDSLLTLESLRTIPALRPLLSAQPPLREDDALAILLLHERGRGAASKWAPHIAILPTRVDNALNFSPAVLERLGSSQLGHLARQLQQQTRQDYAEISGRPGLVLSESDGDDGGRGPRTLLECAWWDWEGYRWALSMIHSRFVSVATPTTAEDGGGEKDGEGEQGQGPRSSSLKAMAPFFDLLNHSGAEPPSLAHGFAPALNALAVQSTTALPANRELCLNYGPHSPLKLLMLYGFLPQTSDDDIDRYASVDLYISTDPATTPGYPQKAQALAALGLPPAGAHAHSVTAAAPHIPPALLATLRIQRAATDAEMAGLEGAARGLLSPANERATLGALKGALESMLAALPPAPTPAPLPVGEGEDWGEGGLLGMVNLYVASERRVLQRALGRVAELEEGI